MQDKKATEIIESIVKEHGAYPVLEVNTGSPVVDPVMGILHFLFADRIVLQEYNTESMVDFERKKPIYFREIKSIRHITKMDLVHRLNIIYDSCKPSRSAVRGLKEIAGKL